MSQENLEIVKRMYEAFDGGDTESALGFLDPSIVTDASHRVDGRVGRGQDALIMILAEWMDTWEDWSHEVEEIRDLGDRVLVVETQHGRGKGSGAEWTGRFAMLFDLEDGKITRWTIYDDLAEGLEAVGMPPE